MCLWQICLDQGSACPFTLLFSSLPSLFLIITSNIYVFLKIYLFGEREKAQAHAEKEEGQRERIFTQAPCSA